MSKDETDTRPQPQRGYPESKARQGDIVLKHRWSRWVFIGALAGFVLLALVVRAVFFAG